MRLKRIQKEKPYRLDLRVLEKLATLFRIELKNRFDTLKDEEPSIEKMNTVLREAMDTIQNQTQKPTIEKNTEDTEIENLDKKRKELRQKNKQKTKRQGRICRTQQISEEETQNKSTEEKKRINTGNTGSKKRSKTSINIEINK